MPAHARLSACTLGGTVRPTQEVLLLRDKLKMPRVAARPHPTQMVNRRAATGRERHAMLKNVG
jgi:hypothetical protein